MRGKKYYIALDDSERRVVGNCLNETSKGFTAQFLLFIFCLTDYSTFIIR